MSNYLRIIKILTPSNEFINVELGGDEKELLDLLSMVVNIPSFDIKGLKDCYGNYYTLSSAVHNPSINCENSEFYYLICNSQNLNSTISNSYLSERRSGFIPNQYAYPTRGNANPTNVSFNRNNVSSQKVLPAYNQRGEFSNSRDTNNKTFLMPHNYNNMNHPLHSANNRPQSNQKFLTKTNSNIVPLNSHYTEFSNRNPTLLTGIFRPKENPIQKFNEFDQFTPSDFYYNSNQNQYSNFNNPGNTYSHTPSYFNGNYIAKNNSYEPQQNNILTPHSNSNSFLPRFGETPNIERYLSIAQELYESNQIDSVLFSKLSQMILKENEEIINLIKIYTQDIIDKKTLIGGFNKILSSFIQNNSRPTSPIQAKSKLVSLIEQIENDIFEDSSDAVLLKNLIEYENEFIMGAFEVYESDKDLDNFIESIKILIARSKRKPSLYNQNEHKLKQGQLFNNCNDGGNQIKNNLSTINLKVPNTNETYVGLEESSKNDISISKNKSSSRSNSKYSLLDKETVSQIYANLHTEERVIFKYALSNNFPQIEIIAQLLNAFKKTDLLIKPAKLLCKDFIKENILKNFDEEQKQKFLEILVNREKNKNLVVIFKDFQEHNSVSKLEKDVLKYVKAQIKDSQNKKTQDSPIKDKRRQSFSDTNSNVENDESLLKTKRNDLSENNLEEFINLINVMKFLKPEQKKDLENMLKSKNKYAMEVVDNYHKNKNIASLKSSVMSLLRRRSGVQASTSNTSSIVNQQYETKSTIPAPSKIFKKLEKNESSKNSNENYLTTSSTKNFTNIESLLEDLERTGKISSLQHKYIHQRYKNNDELVMSTWEVYLKTKDLTELVESLKVFTSNIKKLNNSNPPPVTPADLKESKKEIIEFLKLKNNKKEKETVKIMQYNMIKILARDSSIEKNYLPILKDMILEENTFLISAFEVFGVTKDHKDFSHTINMIAYLYNKNNISDKRLTPQSSPKPSENKDDKLKLLFDNFLNTPAALNAFNEGEKESLKRKIIEKNQILMSSLELYEISQDAEELIDTLIILLKK